jgi:ribosomal protein S27E
MMVKRKCSINDSIKTEYPFIKGVNENAECTLCNAVFCIADGGRSDVVSHVKTKK